MEQERKQRTLFIYSVALSLSLSAKILLANFDSNFSSEPGELSPF